MLGMPYIRALEVATFYSMFNLAPVGKYFIQFCGTTPCVLRGCRRHQGGSGARVGPQAPGRADGMFSWLEVECLGACCNAPMVQINDDYYEDLTAENFETLLDDLAAGRPVTSVRRSGARPRSRSAGSPRSRRFYGVDGKSGAGRRATDPQA